MIQSITGLAQVSQRLGRYVLIHQALMVSAEGFLHSGSQIISIPWCHSAQIGPVEMTGKRDISTFMLTAIALGFLHFCPTKCVKAR